MRNKIRLSNLMRFIIFISYMTTSFFGIRSSEYQEVFSGMLFWFFIEILDNPKQLCIIYDLVKIIWKFMKEVVNAFLRIPRI